MPPCSRSSATPIHLLPAPLVERWRALLEARSPEIGPFLHPEFVRAVAAVRPGVEVGLIEADGEVCGFLPYQRGRWDIALPVAGRLCDQSGAVLRPGVKWNAPDFARAAGLRAIRLPNTPTDDPGLSPHQAEPKRIYAIDIARGFETYRRENLASGSRFFRQIESRIRKAEARYGPMRFEWQSDDAKVFDALLRWKAIQRRRTRTPNIFDLPWARSLLGRLHRLRLDDFEGVLSAVYFGDTLAAAHFGIRSSTVLQYWVPGYDEALGPFSPGLACLVAVAREAANRGLVRIDLGVGEQPFKERAGQPTREVATATVRADAAVGAVFSMLDRLRIWARASSGGPLFHRLAQAIERESYRAYSRRN